MFFCFKLSDSLHGGVVVFPIDLTLERYCMCERSRVKPRMQRVR